MKKKYFDWEYVFEFISQQADDDGIWNGDDVAIATEFGVSENEGYAVLGELCDRNHIQKMGTATYFITRWREKVERDEELSC
jgi:hypothetical protein